MFHIVLVEPKIPPNTGNVIRLCANTGAQLHLIQPLGFALDDKKLKRAGLDYHEWATMRLYENLAAFLEQVKPNQVWAFSTHGKTCYTQPRYQKNDALLFGPETGGLAKAFLASLPAENILRIPMLNISRSLNLSNSVAVALYEAWRQNNFSCLTGK